VSICTVYRKVKPCKQFSQFRINFTSVVNARLNWLDSVELVDKSLHNYDTRHIIIDILKDSINDYDYCLVKITPMFVS
jgi:hypothetical protein